MKVWIMGFVADFIGTFAMFMSNLIDFDARTEFGKWWISNISNAVRYNPFENFFSFIWVTVCVALTACLIYIINDKWCLKKADFSDEQRRRVALSLAVFTAPYLFFLPTECFFLIPENSMWLKGLFYGS